MNLEEKKILTFKENEIDLSYRSDEIDVKTQNPEMRQIVADLKLILKKHPEYVSISAPAIGYRKRIFCIRFDQEIKTFINPIITNVKGLHLSKETSVVTEEKKYIIPRNNDITVMYQRPQGQIETKQIVGLSASIFQQEFQMLDGITLADIGLEIDDDFENASEEERQEVIEMYIDSLDLTGKELNKEIQDDPELKKVSDAIDFMYGVKTGEVKLEKIEENTEKEISES